jgi:myo-inositol-1(or 4)-monophosphatase
LIIDSTLPSLLELAKNAAYKAGSTLIEKQKFARQVDHYQARDVKINGDILSETVIVESLQLNSSFPILSEEAGIIGKIDREQYLWIVDPLDGSLNYSHGIPLFCISVALWKGKEPILGVIFDFSRNELFSGIIGEGAWLNETAIKISETKKKKEAILCTGFPINTDFSEEGITKFVKQMQAYKKIRLLGSAALSLAYVACGRVDVYMEDNIMLWDVGAGCAIVKAAGGEIQIDNCNDLLAPKKVTAKNSASL